MYLLPASQTRDKDALTEDGVASVVAELRERFDWVVCDFPAGIERGATLAMRHADIAVVVTNPEVSSVRNPTASRPPAIRCCCRANSFGYEYCSPRRGAHAFDRAERAAAPHEDARQAARAGRAVSDAPGLPVLPARAAQRARGQRPSRRDGRGERVPPVIPGSHRLGPLEATASRRRSTTRSRAARRAPRRPATCSSSTT